MKMTFHGLSRTVYSHSHEVAPGRWGRGKKGEPLQWSSSTVAHGRMYGLGLGGNFRVQFEFESAELRNWLTAFVRERPAEALKLLLEMQAGAIVALSESKDEEESES